MDNVPIINYSTGEVIIEEGDETNDIFLIVSGKVRITRKTEKSIITLATQGKDTIFGEMTLIDGTKRSATVIAMEPTSCYLCNGMALIKEINKLPGELRDALKSMSAMIRKSNKAACTLEPFSEETIYPHENRNLMTEDEIKSKFVQDSINSLSNPFIRSLFRVMMITAFKK